MLNLGVTATDAVTLTANVNPYDALPDFKFLAPDLTMIILGINDATELLGINNFKTNMQILINAALLSGDVMLVTFFPADAVITPIANQLAYIKATVDLAIANNIPFLDENTALVSRAAMTAKSLNTDGLHPNKAGCSCVARDVANFLLPILGG